MLAVSAAAIAGAAEPIVVNDDGGWCWFQDERAIIVDGKFVLGSIAMGYKDPSRRGNVEITVFNPADRSSRRVVLHPQLQNDDHDLPALHRRSDGRILAVYCKHGSDNRIYHRLTERADDALDWQPERVFVPSPSSRVTYSNLLFLPAENGGRGRLHNFFRGWDNHFKPSWMTSDDQGETWQSHGLWIDMPSDKRHRPYVKYAGNGADTIHFLFTEAHPRDYDNSLYHAFYRNGQFHRSDGTIIGSAAAGPLTPPQATRIFPGGPDNVAWASDLHLDSAGHPVAVYSVHINARQYDKKDPRFGSDHRYRYARWNGSRWIDRQIAFAGRRLYPGEDDYTGNLCLDPQNPDRVFISTDVDPATGRKLPGGHFEIFQGITADHAETWQWTSLTPGAAQDNLRPIVPIGDPRGSWLFWLRGSYHTYTRYEQEIVAIPIGQ